MVPSCTAGVLRRACLQRRKLTPALPQASARRAAPLPAHKPVTR